MAKFREKLNAMIDRHEGNRLKVYRCQAGHKTISRGWNMDANPLPKNIRDYLAKNGRITPEMSDELMTIAIDRAISDCYRLFPEFDTFTDNRRMALIDFVFQLGLSRSSQFIHTIAAINRGHWEDAAEGIRKSLYWKQLGGDPPGTDDGKLERPEEIALMILNG